ncbi:hypothetical protein C2G38_2208893 [Gigaspora rosea]|uniref:Uncharacterized protein n=1 Tax=Gigaspora rosea TaxID=44941 RepID=A0A397UJQ0_9GLOM|nr:hypothetical protein C2G38_2208893 [Gigaspora rosea]
MTCAITQMTRSFPNDQSHMIKGTDEILSGYNPIGWVKPTTGGVEYKYCNDSFIFLLKNRTVQNSI